MSGWETTVENERSSAAVFRRRKQGYKPYGIDSRLKALLCDLFGLFEHRVSVFFGI